MSDDNETVLIISKKPKKYKKSINKEFKPKRLKCDHHQCNRSYSFRSGLTYHKRVAHTTYEESKFKCTFKGCHKYFPNSSQDHLNKHNNIRPFKCNNRRCNKSFYSQSNRWKHMKNHCKFSVGN
jgi:hypothetical protein